MTVFWGANEAKFHCNKTPYNGREREAPSTRNNGMFVVKVYLGFKRVKIGLILLFLVGL